MDHTLLSRCKSSLAWMGRLALLSIFTVGCLASPTAATTEPAAPTVTSAPLPSPLPPTPTPIKEIPVNVWLTTADKSNSLSPQPSILFGQDASAPAAIYVNENNIYQQMEGFGASMTDSSAWLIYTTLSEAQRRSVMSALFSLTEGIGVSVTRIPMGASDFVNGAPYTYDDMPPGEVDPDLLHFSIEHDKAYIIPALQDALELNPQLKIIASPWSPPAWMKTSDSLLNGSLLEQYYLALAQYFVKFIQAYQAENLPIYAITLQNEPYFEPNTYPGMYLDPYQAIDLVKNHLKPALEAAGLQTRILVWDHNWDNWQYPLKVLDDPEAKSMIDGVAFHCYAGTVIAQTIVHDAHPDKDIYFTECSGGTWIGSYETGLRSDMKDLVIGATRNWAKTVIKWNLALDAQHNPHSGGCGTCDGLVTIDPGTESGFTTNFDYYTIGHVSKFVFPGAVRIASTALASGLESVAFKNPDGSKVLIVTNTSFGDQDRPFVVRWGARAFAYALPGAAIATFTWSGEQEITAPPSAPLEISTNTSNGRVAVKWEFSPLALSYTVKRSETAGGPYTVLASDMNLPEYFDPAVTAGSSYYYVVSAANLLGESPDSAEAAAIP